MDAQSVLIVGIAYADKDNMTFEALNDHWFDKQPIVDGLDFLRVHGDAGRSEMMRATYETLDLDKFLSARLQHSPETMMDYGASDGRVGMRLAETMNVGKIIFVNGDVDDLMKRSSRVKSINAKKYGVPNIEQPVDGIMLNDVVSWMSDREKMLECLRGLVSLTSENGVIFVVQTDDTEWKMKNVQSNFQYVLHYEPDLLHKILFILPRDADSKFNEARVLDGYDGDLASQLKMYRTQLHDKEFVIHEIRQT